MNHVHIPGKLLQWFETEGVRDRVYAKKSLEYRSLGSPLGAILQRTKNVTTQQDTIIFVTQLSSMCNYQYSLLLNGRNCWFWCLCVINEFYAIIRYASIKVILNPLIVFFVGSHGNEDNQNGT